MKKSNHEEKMEKYVKQHHKDFKKSRAINKVLEKAEEGKIKKKKQ